MISFTEEPPRYNGSSVYVVNVTKSLRVELQLKGSPDENSTVWTSSNSGMTPLAVGGRIEALGNNFIAFSEVNRSDAGRYRVASSNCAGAGSFQFSIVVNCKLTPCMQWSNHFICALQIHRNTLERVHIKQWKDH